MVLFLKINMERSCCKCQIYFRSLLCYVLTSRFCILKDTSGSILEDKHGEILLQVSDLFLFTVASHNGDPNLQFLNILVNKGDVYHQGNVQKIFYNFEYTLSNINA